LAGLVRRGGFTLDVQAGAGFVFKSHALGGALSDSAHQGDAARLEAALDRIVQALGRSAVPRAALPDPDLPGHVAAPSGVDERHGGVSDVEEAAAGLVVALAVQAGADARGHPADLAQIGFRLDSLIADLRAAPALS